MAESFDFIVVGAGPAGTVLASRLASSSAAPSVLLIEAGEANDAPSLDERMISNRMATSVTHPELSWGYKTAPQAQLANRLIDYSRGKGLGGSSLINYAFWTIPPAADYDRWASIVGDDAFSWKQMQQRLKKLERLHSDVDETIKQYVDPLTEHHGTDGELDVELPKVIEPEIASFLADLEKAGHPINRDLNSGDPIGVGLMISSSYRGIRTTAQSAFLKHTSSNLVIRTGSHVERIVVEGKVAVGVEIDGTIIKASKEVIVCAGALDSPKLLMLSGIGDSSQLSRHGIPVVNDLPGVGKNLQDHAMVMWAYQRKPSPGQSYDAWHNDEAAAAARRQLEEDGTGPFAVNGQGYVLAFLKDEATLKSDEFRALPSAVQRHFEEPTVPTYEVAWGLMHPMPGMDPTQSYLVMAACSRTCSRLAATNFINSVKAALAIPGNPAASADIDFPLNAPSIESDEEIWSYIQQNTAATWHMSCTVKMGTDSDEDACVDATFRVRGIRNLRIADMSVTPFLPSAHPVATAYLIGQTAAEKLIAEYEHAIEGLAAPRRRCETRTIAGLTQPGDEASLR